jgi:hypothetical protein
MITRLAVRFERAGLFFLKPGEYIVGNGFGDVEFVEAGMNRCGIWDLGLRIYGSFEFLEPMVDLLDTRVQRCEVSRLSFEQPG